MVSVEYHEHFLKKFEKLHPILKFRIRKQIQKIIENPIIGKPMLYNRRGTRELYISPFRLSYLWNEQEDSIAVLDFYHKDEQ